MAEKQGLTAYVVATIREWAEQALWQAEGRCCGTFVLAHFSIRADGQIRSIRRNT